MVPVIAGITQVRNEADVIERCLSHTLAEGVEPIWVADHLSTDGTWELLRDLQARGMPLILSRNDDPVWHLDCVNDLAAVATEAGADWIVPFDGDEFFYALSGRTIAAELADGHHSRKLYCRCWRQATWHHREVAPQREKVVYRPSPGARLAWGQHDVDIPGGTWDVLYLRHWQYRSWEQFYAKVRALANVDPTFVQAFGPSPLLAMSDDELFKEWDRLSTVETVYDPVPSRVAV